MRCPTGALAAALIVLVGCGGAADTTRVEGSVVTAGVPVPAVSPAEPPATGTTSTPPPSATKAPSSPAAPSTAPRPAIHQWPIPYGPARKRQMASYSLRHYGEDTYVLSDPKVIVEHYTETSTAQEAYNTFAPDVPDSEFHELPNTCAHFLVERDGRIDQLVPLSLRCRHTVGLNWTAIGIENVGLSDQAILDDPAQISASLRLTRWLRCRFGIPPRDVIGHNESLSSPYHHDRVPAFRHQTHSDWNHADMQRYRALLARHGCA
jgi:N-acetylmuramoyl-L-alanine amidase